LFTIFKGNGHESFSGDGIRHFNHTRTERLGQIAVFFVQKTQKSGTKNCIMPDF